MMWFVYTICIIYTFVFGDALLAKHTDPNHHKPHIENNFIGVIYETSNEVLVQPPLLATDEDAPQLQGLICEYRLYSKDKNDDDIPFFISVANMRTGEARLFLKPNLTLAVCDNETQYHLLISAVDCGIGRSDDGQLLGQRSSHKSHLDVSLVADNLHNPYFPVPSYYVDIEGDISVYQPILSIEAADDDCSQVYGDVCRYKILGDHAELFEITEDGLLLSTKEIKAKEHEIILNVSAIAVDCGERESAPTTIIIKINRLCRPTWSGFKENVEFAPAQTTTVSLYQNSALNMCIPPRDIVNIRLTVSLNLNQIEALTGCDRDTYSMKDARRLCAGKDQKLLELLPSYPEYKELETSLDTNFPELPQFKRSIAAVGSRIYNFNGKDQALEISYPTLSQQNLTSQFSVSFRLFLNNTANRTSNEKSTILCKSDSAGLSRHHLSIYVQKCHIMLLIRQENGAKMKLSPAEWHWKIGNDKKCSGKWFEILFTVSFPNSTLFINGVQQKPFLIADDYPLHPTPIPSKWIVGAAWEGRKATYAQFFRGKLSDLVFHLGALEDVDVLKCAGRCKEGLTSNSARARSSDSQFTLHLESNGSDIHSLYSQLKNLSYFNSRQYPISGLREVSLQTRLVCTPSAVVCPYIPPLHISVDVLPPPDPMLTIAGPDVIVRSLESIKDGNLHFFAELSLTSGAQTAANEELHSRRLNLDSCNITEKGDGKKGRLEIKSRNALERDRLMLAKRDDGITIRGVQTIKKYEEILRDVAYTNDAFNGEDIVFCLQCFELNGRYHSNLYTLAVMVQEEAAVHLFPKAIPEHNPLVPREHHPPPAALLASKYGGDLFLKEAERAEAVEEQLLLAEDSSRSRTSAHTAALVIGICVCAVLVLVIAITVQTKLRGCPGEQEDDEEAGEVVKEQIYHEMDEGELDWDDSAMTITVNPMEEAMEVAEDASDFDFSEIDEDAISDMDTRDVEER